MIDPLTTLGLISNVLQVADFSIRILAKTDEIARSADGAIEENRDLERCATELILRNQNLSESLVRNDGEKDGWDKDDVILTRLGHDCNTVARELIECLSDLRSYRGRSTFKSIRQAIKTLYSREKVETISKRMKEFQDEMNGALLQSISLRQRLTNAEQTERFNNLDRGERQILDSVKTMQQLFTSQLNSQTDILLNILATHHNQTRNLLSAVLPEEQKPVPESTESLDSAADGRSIYQLAEEGSTREIQALLRRKPQAARSTDNHGRTPLHFAAKSGHADLASYFIRKGADVNAEDDSFVAPLHLAAEGDHVAVVRVLLQKGADPDVVDSAHLQPRQYSSNEEIAWMLANGPDLGALNSDGNPALFVYAVNGKHDIVKSLLDQKATPDVVGACGGLPLMKAAEHGYLSIVELLYHAGAKINARSHNDRLDTALGLAAMHGHLQVVVKLIDWGADVDAMNGWHHTPLNEACAHAHEDVAIHLILNGANPNTEDHLGCLPITRAAETGCLGTIRALVNAGVRVDSENSSNGRTALAEACIRGDVAVVQYLLEHSASPTHKDRQSWTPLHLVARHGHIEILNCLLMRYPDVDVGIRTNEGETPISIAGKQGHERAVGVLLAHLADRPTEMVQG